jgi:hypothetical protein
MWVLPLVLCKGRAPNFFGKQVIDGRAGMVKGMGSAVQQHVPWVEVCMERLLCNYSYALFRPMGCMSAWLGELVIRFITTFRCSVADGCALGTGFGLLGCW